MKETLALLAVLFLIALFFLPAYYIGPPYVLLVAVYLLTLYAVEKRGLGKTAERAVGVVFFIVVMSLIMKKMEEPLWQALALGGLILALELIKGRRSRDENLGEPGAG
ncbi:hypothetical protein [Thermococcus sp. 21S7]|uniref:hypothetical protein n=1 Tax=Thermococcus sp. 21S7 TaxID=1638221 RepID=UPI00143BDB85|nr:hypothetical protein [Thermococcus sp. 21S7]NJE60282.1 hypothetical protein [Thermococcus sp. 21S7]